MTKKITSGIAVAIFWAMLGLLSLVLSHNAVLYFTHGGEYGILPEKIEARKELFWNIAFYAHLPAGVICLLTPFVLFARRYVRQNLNLHRIVGSVYVYVTLWVVCPTGLYLALYAKGGLVTQVGFFVQGILLGWFSWQAFAAIKQGDKINHFQFVIRSYASACVVLTFRLLHLVFFFLKIPYLQNYAISQWLGISFNLLVAELIILYINLKKSPTLKFKTL